MCVLNTQKIGPKFAGKSEEMMRHMDRFVQANRKVVLVRPSSGDGGMMVQRSSIPIG